MAITPNEARKRATPDEATLKGLEARIDREIVERIRAGTTAITVEASPVLDAATRREITERYRAAGWTVRYISDQREGNYLTFTPARTQYDDPRDTLIPAGDLYGDR